jgi:2,3-bisphosphoglycerate-dependent phosphoglycerate mutase
MVLTLSLVRHGQTEYNAAGRLQGWCDSPLTPGGLAGVRTTAAHLAPQPIAAVYVSPSGRAQATARELVAHHPAARVIIDPDLREFGFGDFEARLESELYAQFDPEPLFASVLHGTFPGLPGGERGSDFLARVGAAFARIEAAHPTGHVLVVSHGLTLRAYLTMIDGARPMRPLPNASISTVQVTPRGPRRVASIGVDPGRPAEDAVVVG